MSNGDYLDTIFENLKQHCTFFYHIRNYNDKWCFDDINENLIWDVGEFEIDVQQFKDDGERFINRVNGAVEIQGEIKSYVQKLEKAYDMESGQTSEIPSSETMIEELETFFRNQLPKDE